jgi:ATP-binding cassette subfamily G (WHITE) protein 2 (PDR)
VYFGDIGENSRTLIEYFEKNGAKPCGADANPAEWMLEVVGAAPGSYTNTDWFQVWRSSPEYKNARTEIDGLISEHLDGTRDTHAQQDNDNVRRAFAAPFAQQMREVIYRVFEQYWRTPSYLYSKLALCLISSLFVGFVFFDAATTQRGLQNQMFSIFVHLTIFQQLSQQIMPHFVTQRSLYEARERQSKTYSWQAFILNNMFVEICWNSLMAVVIFLCYYYPVGLYRNAQYTDQVHLRGGLYFLFMLQFMLWGSTFTNMIIAGMLTAEEGANIANFLFSLALVFCGVLASPESLPRFWIFVSVHGRLHKHIYILLIHTFLYEQMYPVSPFTYLIGACSALALPIRRFDAPTTSSCISVRPAASPAANTCSRTLIKHLATFRPPRTRNLVASVHLATRMYS